MNVYKERSYVACIRDGFRFFAKNLKPLCRIMLPYCIIISVVSMLFNVYMLRMGVTITNGTTIQISDIMLGYVFLFLIMVAMMLCFLYADGRLMLYNRRMMGVEPPANKLGTGKHWIITQKRTNRMVKRMLPFMAIFMIMTLVCMLTLGAFLAVGSACGLKGLMLTILIMPIFLLLFIALFAAIQPLTYSAFEFLIEDRKITLRNIWKSYKNGCKYTLKYMGVTLLTYFITIVVTLILRLPEYVFTQAYTESFRESLLNGEEVHISSLAMIMILIFSALISAIVLLVNHIPLNFVQLYLYGDAKMKQNQHVSDYITNEAYNKLTLPN